MYFEQTSVELKTVADAGKEKMDRNRAWALIRGKKKIHIAKGKKTLSFEPDEESREAILKEALGRSGTLRAPTLTVGEVMYIGFNDAMYQAFLGQDADRS